MIRRPPRSTRTDTLFPYTTLFRSQAQFQSFLLTPANRSSHGFDHHVPDRGVGTWDMIVPVKAACRRAERAAHDQPHDQLNPFASGLTQIFYMLDPACLFAFADKHVHETVVPLAIKQACTRALKLVAHAASAPDLDVEEIGRAHV